MVDFGFVVNLASETLMGAADGIQDILMGLRDLEHFR